MLGAHFCLGKWCSFNSSEWSIYATCVAKLELIQITEVESELWPFVSRCQNDNYVKYYY